MSIVIILTVLLRGLVSNYEKVLLTIPIYAHLYQSMYISMYINSLLHIKYLKLYLDTQRELLVEFIQDEGSLPANLVKILNS